MARGLLDELAPPGVTGAHDEHVPIVVQAVASRARKIAAGDEPDQEIARALGSGPGRGAG